MAVGKGFISPLFSTFLLSTVFEYSLTALPKGGGELVDGDGPDDPFPWFLEAVLVQGEAYQLFLHHPEQEEIH